MVELLKRATHGTGDDDGDSTTVTGTMPPAWRVADRLDDEAVAGLLDAYRDGTTARALASRYQVGLSTVKRLLRRHGVRKHRAASHERHSSGIRLI